MLTSLVVGVILALLLGAALWRPPLAVAAGLLMFALEQWAQSQGGVFAAHPVLLNALVAIVIVAALSRALTTGRTEFRLGAGSLSAVLILFALAGFSYLWTPDPQAFLEQWQANAPYLLMLSLTLPLLICDLDDARVAFFGLVIFGIPVLLLLVFTTEWTYRGVAVQDWGRHERANPLAVASFAGHMIIVAALLNVRARRLLWEVTRWVVVAVAVYMSMMSGTRGQTIAAIFVVALALPFSRGVASFNRFVATFSGITVIGLVVFVAGQAVLTGDRWSVSSMSATMWATRIAPALELLNGWGDAGPVYWIVGLGNSASFHPSLLGYYPHVVPVEVLAEQGVVGFCCLVVCGVLLVRAAVLGYRATAGDSVRRSVLVCAVALATFELIISFKQGSMLKSYYLFMFLLLAPRLTASLISSKAMSSRAKVASAAWGLSR